MASFDESEAEAEGGSVGSLTARLVHCLGFGSMRGIQIAQVLAPPNSIDFSL